MKNDSKDPCNPKQFHLHILSEHVCIDPLLYCTIDVPGGHHTSFIDADSGFILSFEFTSGKGGVNILWQSLDDVVSFFTNSEYC